MGRRSDKVGKGDNTTGSDDDEYMNNMANNLNTSCENCKNYQSSYLVKSVNNIMTKPLSLT